MVSEDVDEKPLTLICAIKLNIRFLGFHDCCTNVLMTLEMKLFRIENRENLCFYKQTQSHINKYFL